MTVNYAQVHEYQRRMGVVTGEAASRVASMAAGIDWSRDDAEDLLAAGTSAVYDAYGTAASQLSGQFYQSCYDSDPGTDGTYRADAAFDFAMTVENVIRQVLEAVRVARNIGTSQGDVGKSLEAIVANAVEAAGRQVLFDNLTREAGRDALTKAQRKRLDVAYAITGTDTARGRGGSSRSGRGGGSRVGYARVPTSDCACAFCVVMASRGFVYWTAESAGSEPGKYHEHCRCTVVRLGSKEAKISGYSEDKYLEQYEAAKRLLASDDIPDALQERLDSLGPSNQINRIEVAMRYLYGMT